MASGSGSDPSCLVTGLNQNRVLFFGAVASGANPASPSLFPSLCAWASLLVASHGRGVNTSCRAFPTSGNESKIDRYCEGFKSSLQTSFSRSRSGLNPDKSIVEAFASTTQREKISLP